MSAPVAGALLALSVLMWPVPVRLAAGWQRPVLRVGKLSGRARRRRGHRSAIRRRQPREEVGVAETMDLLALSLQGGAGVLPALRSVAACIGGEHGRELCTVAAAMAWGSAEDRAWSEVPAHWGAVRRALDLAGRAGVPPAGLLTAGAADLREDQRADLEARAARLSVHLVLPLGLAFLPAFVLTTVVPVVLALATGLLTQP